MRRPISALACLTVAMAMSIPTVQLLSSTAAQAVEPGSVGAAAASSWQSNGTVWHMAYANGDIFMVGDFTSLRPSGDPLGTGEVPANYFAALNASTGELDPNVAHTHTFTTTSPTPLKTGVVTASADGMTVYVGGSFSAVDGVKRNHIAAFSAATGALLPWNPNVGGKVSAIAAAGNTVYIGGTFTKVATTTVSDLVAVSAATGAVLPNWLPAADAPVDAMAVTPDDTQVVIGGYFHDINGLPSNGLTTYNKAAIIGGEASAQPGVPQPMTADSVVPPGFTGHPVNNCISNVKDAVISNGVAYLANEGTGGGCFDGTWAVNLSDGSLKWVNRCLGATQVVEVVGNYLYKGSHAHDCRSRNVNGDPDNFPQVPVNQGRHELSENLSNGFLGPWDPFSNAGKDLGPRAMATDGTQLYLGGDFTQMNHKGQQGIARFTPTSDFVTPKPLPPTATSTLSGTVTITATAPVDLDDSDLTLQLFRDGSSIPIASTNVHSLFWRQPVVTWTDTGLVSGSSHTYKVKAIETFGSGSSTFSTASSPVVVH